MEHWYRSWEECTSTWTTSPPSAHTWSWVSTAGTTTYPAETWFRGNIDCISVVSPSGKASRTEKYLGACAAGKWVLHKSYLEACRAASRFVEEESHEWGVAVGGAEVHPLEAAPRRWRLKLAEQQKVRGRVCSGGCVELSGDC